ncbi:MAG: TetR/AcrR family transcriptional regulator, partial [Frankia sp.]
MAEARSHGSAVGSAATARPAPRVAVTRDRILSVAGDLFAERGFAGTSVRDIAAALGVTKAALYYHFTSKDEILDAMMTPAFERFEAFARTAPGRFADDPRQVLTDLADLIAATATAFAPFANDPSVLHHSARTREIKIRFEEVVNTLAETIPGPHAVLRVRCAVGAVQGAVFATMRPDSTCPPTQDTESNRPTWPPSAWS